jgi:adenylate cyclase class 2
MSAKGQELEVKFLAPDLASIQARLEALGASQVQPRVHETNLRFDTPVGDLGQSSQVLRLRQDTAVRMTYKGPGEVVDGIRKRQELEFSVSDFEMGRAFLEALGYQVVWMYEKYRQMFRLGEVLVTLDEMPFGNFIEIEGPDGASIQAMAGLLDMDWKLRILESYSVLFEDARAALGFTFRDLSFENFEGVDVPAALFAG